MRLRGTKGCAHRAQARLEASARRQARTDNMLVLDIGKGAATATLSGGLNGVRAPAVFRRSPLTLARPSRGRLSRKHGTPHPASLCCDEADGMCTWIERLRVSSHGTMMIVPVTRIHFRAPCLIASSVHAQDAISAYGDLSQMMDTRVRDLGARRQCHGVSAGHRTRRHVGRGLPAQFACVISIEGRAKFNGARGNSAGTWKEQITRLSVHPRGDEQKRPIISQRSVPYRLASVTSVSH